MKHTHSCLVLLASLLLACPVRSEGARSQEAQSDVRITPTVKAVRKAMPWVVSIGTEIDVRVNDPYIVRLNNYFALRRYKSRIERQYTPLGSGVIIDPNGLALTNWHVARAADKLLLKLFNGRSFPAEVVGYDVQSDLCLLKLSGDFKESPLTPASFASPDDLMLGETVITLGNPFGLEHSVASGVLSAINRELSVTGEPYNDMLQTDAAINPGNSGGPLINLDGDVIGVNQAIRSDAQGIGFAIPAKRLEFFLSHWLLPETFSNARLGISNASFAEDGVAISVAPGTPAFEAGLRDGSLVTAVNGAAISRPLELGKLLWGLQESDTLQLRLSDGKTVSVALRPMEAEECIWTRLGVRVQKLTRKLNIALELPEEMKGLAISEVVKPDEYKDEDDGWRKYLKRGDLILQVEGEGVENEKQLADLLKEKRSGSLLMVDFAIMNSNARYQLKRDAVLLK